MSTDTAILHTQNKNFANPVQKQSLSELVTSLRNCNAPTTRLPSHGLSAASSIVGSAASEHSFIPRSFRCNTPELISLHRIQTTSVKAHDQSNISASPLMAPRQALNMPESRCSQTPNQTTVARFRFKRMPTTPVLPPGRSSVDMQLSATAHQQSFMLSVTQVCSTSSASVSTTTSAVSQTADYEDMWTAGKHNFTVLLISYIHLLISLTHHNIHSSNCSISYDFVLKEQKLLGAAASNNVRPK